MCCCLPVIALKVWAVIGGLGNIGLGAFWIYLRSVFSTLADALVPEEFEDEVGQYIDLVQTIFLAFGIVEIVVGVIMMLMALWRSKCLIFICVILTIIYFIVSAAFGVAGNLLPGLLKDQLKDSTKEGCFQLDAIAKANMALGVLNVMWCRATPKEIKIEDIPQEVIDDLKSQGIDIPILEGQDIPAGYDIPADNQQKITTAQAESYLCKCGVKEDNLSKWEGTEKDEMTEGSDPDGPVIVLECNSFKEKVSSEQSNDFDALKGILESIEDYFSCTGICTGDYKHYFLDVNNGPPEHKDEGCYVVMRKWMDNLLGTLFIIGIVGAVFNLLTILMLCGYCCKTLEKKDAVKAENN